MPIDINLLRAETGKIFMHHLMLIGSDPALVKKSE